MHAYLIQSVETWEFLHVSPRNGDVTWTPSLLTALRHGLVMEAEEVAQLVFDHCDAGGSVVIDVSGELARWSAP